MIDELLEQFLIEGRDQCRDSARALERLAGAPDDRAALEACFRAVHTLKGSTGLFDLAPLGQMLHAAEDRLDAARRDGRLPPAELAGLLRIIDLAETWLDYLASHGALPADAADQAQSALSAVGGAAPAQPTTAGAVTQIRYVPRPDAYFAGDDPVAIIAAVPQLTQLRLDLGEPHGSGLYDPFRCRLVIEAASTAPPDAIRKALAFVIDQVTMETAATEETSAADASADTAGPRTMRLAVERLDEMARLAEELTAARSGLADMAEAVARLPGGMELGRHLSGRLARVARLSDEIRGAVGQARLVPLSGLFERLPRLVRTLSETLGKPAALSISGGALEVDRAVVEGLADPFLHVLRNAMDHGLESPELRSASGKPATGTLRVIARRLGAEVAIDIQDDGRGIDLEAIRARAIERGLIDVASATGLGDEALIELIFHPGFTTAREATSVSGRGVGMDAVRTAAGKLGGRVQIRSEQGKGATVTFIMPASIMLTPLAVVSCAGSRYALPLAGLSHTISASLEAGAQVVNVAGRLTPLTHLADRLGAARAKADSAKVVLLEAGGAVAVDAVHGRIDASVRPLTGLLAGAPGFIGWAAAADGTAMLVLDTQALAS
ncbi:ATP-binding protein [Caulobacter sp. 73W]|uniref:Chemotaxis protein CheA n=1 Tax=Caulobacter sp. 73W TaxID=3161137 RepID=A0AB39KYF3_9CAUL